MLQALDVPPPLSLFVLPKAREIAEKKPVLGADDGIGTSLGLGGAGVEGTGVEAMEGLGVMLESLNTLVSKAFCTGAPELLDVDCFRALSPSLVPESSGRGWRLGLDEALPFNEVEGSARLAP